MTQLDIVLEPRDVSHAAQEREPSLWEEMREFARAALADGVGITV
jgi:hypothetical protein